MAALGQLRILKPGMLATLQDRGRFRQQAYGVTQAGAADYLSFYWANRLLNNVANSTVIEIAFGGLQFESTVHTNIAVTGANGVLRINGVAKPMWQNHSLLPGDMVKIGRPVQGAWNYVSIRGGIQVKAVLGSSATSTREGIGGIAGDGALLTQGHCLPIYPSQPQLPLQVPKEARAHLPNVVGMELGFVPCCHYFEFPKPVRRWLLQNEFSIAPQSNRMGVRLQPNNLANLDPEAFHLPEKISEATALGAVQLPRDGNPIILLNDRQTMGGYAKIGAVTLPSCWNLAQCRPATKVRFRLIRLSVAQAKYRRLITGLTQTKLIPV